MAHFAKIDTDNTVLTVVTLDDAHCPDDNEEMGRAYLESVHGWPTWKRTSYNTFAGEHKLGGTPFRMNYAGPGYTYNAELDIFIPPKPYPRWVLNTTTYQWEAPVPLPSDGQPIQEWDEENQQWILTTPE